MIMAEFLLPNSLSTLRTARQKSGISEQFKVFIFHFCINFMHKSELCTSFGVGSTSAKLRSHLVFGSQAHASSLYNRPSAYIQSICGVRIWCSSRLTRRTQVCVCPNRKHTTDAVRKRLVLGLFILLSSPSSRFGSQKPWDLK